MLRDVSVEKVDSNDEGLLLDIAMARVQTRLVFGRKASRGCRTIGLLYKASLVRCVLVTMAGSHSSRECLQNPGWIESRCQSSPAWEASIVSTRLLRRDGQKLMGLVGMR